MHSKISIEIRGEGKYLVKEFNTTKKRENKTVEEFNQRFNKLLRHMN